MVLRFVDVLLHILWFLIDQLCLLFRFGLNLIIILYPPKFLIFILPLYLQTIVLPIFQPPPPKLPILKLIPTHFLQVVLYQQLRSIL